MKKVLLFIIPLLAMMSSCIKDDEMGECPSCKDKVRFSLQVCEEGVQYVTRATDERTVRDVNLFLYDPRGVLPDRHFYVEGGTVECSVLPGRYEAYAVVNLHRDMGTRTRERLLEAKISAATSYETLPMSGHTMLTVEDRMPDPIITVRRAVAKVVCNIVIDSSVVYTLKLQSVQLINAVSSTKLFSEEEAGNMFMLTSPLKISSLEGRKATRTFYMFEKLSGRSSLHHDPAAEVRRERSERCDLRTHQSATGRAANDLRRLSGREQHLELRRAAQYRTDARHSHQRE